MPSQKRKPRAIKRDDSFEAVAKRLGADENKGRFEAKLGKIAKAKGGMKNEGATRRISRAASHKH